MTTPTEPTASLPIQIGFAVFCVVNLLGIAGLVAIFSSPGRTRAVARFNEGIKRFFLYELLTLGSLLMLLPFYWMVVTSFKDAETSLTFPPRWTPVRKHYFYQENPSAERVEIYLLENQRAAGQKVRAVPVDGMEFRKVDKGGFTVTEEVPDKARVIMVDPKDKTTVSSSEEIQIDLRNYAKAWYAPEVATRGKVNFGRYFWVSIFTGVVSTICTLATAALAAFAFAKMNFRGKGVFFYIVIITMMVPGQVLLIPSFLILGAFNWLDTYYALIVPFMASVFTIFLMRQFFMTIPDDLWDAAQIDGAGRFRFLWQVVAPLSKPVFITAGIFVFLGNWNSLLWPLIVTSRAEMRTLMVGLQTFNEEAGSDFQLLMSASTMAILPIVVLFFLLQRFFIQGIARTGLK